VIDVFPATHAMRTGIVYVQYINEERAAVMQMVQETIRKMKEKRQVEEDRAILQFPHGPKIANTSGSVAPTIQTNKTNKTNSTIPGSRYGGLLNPNQITAAVNQVPWAISVNNKSFMDALIGKATETMGSDSETDTFRSVNSGRKSIRETELEEENRNLAKKLRDSETQYQQLLKQVHDNERKRQEDGKKQERQMEELRAMILMLMESKSDSRSEGNNNDQGSTPKRKKRADTSVIQEHNPFTGATLEEEFPEESLQLNDSVPDEAPDTPKEGLELT
jgi:hypothetical protein